MVGEGVHNRRWRPGRPRSACPRRPLRALRSVGPGRRLAVSCAIALVYLAASASVTNACGVGESTMLSVTQQPVGGTGGLPFTTQPIVTLTGPGGVVCANDSDTVVHVTLKENPAVFASLSKASTCSDRKPGKSTKIRSKLFVEAAWGHSPVSFDRHY